MLAQRVGRDLVHVGASLPRGMRAVTVVLHKAGSGTEAAVRENRKNRETAAGEVCHQQMAVVCAQAHAAGVPAAGHAAVEEGEFARLFIDRIGRNGRGRFFMILFEFIDGVEEALV